MGNRPPTEQEAQAALKRLGGGGGAPLFGTDNRPAARPDPATETQFGAPGPAAHTLRTTLAGGGFETATLPDGVVPFERLDRRYPADGIHSTRTSPQRPVRIPLSSFRVPDNQALLIYDFKPRIYRFSGLDPFDYVQIDPESLSAQVGWDFRIGTDRQGNTQFQLLPIAGTLPLQRAGQSNAAAFAKAAANAGASSAVGTGLVPQRRERFGSPAPAPWTLIATDGNTVESAAVVFRPIGQPIAFFEFSYSGYQVPRSLATKLFESIGFVPGGRW